MVNIFKTCHFPHSRFLHCSQLHVPHLHLLIEMLQFLHCSTHLLLSGMQSWISGWMAPRNPEVRFFSGQCTSDSSRQKMVHFWLPKTHLFFHTFLVLLNMSAEVCLQSCTSNDLSVTFFPMPERLALKYQANSPLPRAVVLEGIRHQPLETSERSLLRTTAPGLWALVLLCRSSGSLASLSIESRWTPPQTTVSSSAPVQQSIKNLFWWLGIPSD